MGLLNFGNPMNGGLLGLGGLSGGSQDQMASLLGQYYDAGTAKKRKIKAALLGAAQGLMSSPDWGSGLSQGFQAASDEDAAYRQEAMQNFSLAEEIRRRKLEEARQARQDAWSNTQNQHQLEDWQRQDDTRNAQQNYVQSALKSPTTAMPVWQTGQARAYAGMGDYGKAAEALVPQPMQKQDLISVGDGSSLYDPQAGQWIQNPSQHAAKAPQVETFFDERTGQAYKAQYNSETGSWDRVGGLKPNENGITITNPDGTVTQIGGGGNKTTEADRRAALLIQQIQDQEPSLMAGFDSLASINNYAGSSVPGGRLAMSPDAQQASDALTNVVANWLYLTSGATATDAEIARQTAMVTPSPTDAPQTVAAKKARLKSIIDTMKRRAGIPTGQQPGGGTVIDGYSIKQVR